MNIYNNIREIAEQKKIQQKEIAKAMNVGINTVNNWFNGNTSMKAEQIPIIAKILRVSIDSIFKENFEKKCSIIFPIRTNTKKPRSTRERG